MEEPWDNAKESLNTTDLHPVHEELRLLEHLSPEEIAAAFVERHQSESRVEQHDESDRLPDAILASVEGDPWFRVRVLVRFYSV